MTKRVITDKTADLADRLRRHIESDHQRGCMGRQYACSCGYDSATEELLVLAADALASKPQTITVKSCGCVFCDLDIELHEDGEGFHHVIKGARFNCMGGKP